MLSETVNLKSTNAICPICKKNIDFIIKPELLMDACKFPVIVPRLHCDSMILFYLDSHYKVRGVQSVEIDALMSRSLEN